MEAFINNSKDNNNSEPIYELSDKMETLKVPDHCEFLKDGKLFFAEPKLRAENHNAVTDKIKYFREYRANLERAQDLTQQTVDIPASYLDLIAALAQDSDEPLPVLASRLNEILSPFMRNEGVAHKFDVAIEKAIRKIAQRHSYGLKPEVFELTDHTTTNMPWHVYINRWEVHDLSSFPTDLQQVIEMRRESRTRMSEVFSNYIMNLSPTERSAIVNTKHRKPVIVFKETEETKTKAAIIETEQEKDKRLKREEEKKKKEEEKKKREEERKQREEEKRKQREEEKRQKEDEKRKRELEKKKKEQSQLRLTTLFAKTTAQDVVSHVEQKTIEPVEPTLFQPFYIKDHVTIASRELVKPENSSSYEEFRRSIGTSPANASLADFLSNLPSGSKQKRGISTHVDIKTLLLPGSADIMHVPNVRKVLHMKLLQFHEDVRPAYYGTFTRKSNVVCGRRPFARDTNAFDYDVDSEAEWEPEGEGEEIHSGDEDDEDPNTDMIDPEDAGWLVPEGYLSDNEGVDEDGDNGTTGKASVNRKSSKRTAIRKIVLGPFFEGETEEDEVLRPFEMQFLIDVPKEGFNPFYKEPTSRTSQAQGSINTSSSGSPYVAEFTEAHTVALINVIAEKPLESMPNLINEAKANDVLKDVSKRLLTAQIKNLAVKEKRGTDTKPSWYIKSPLTPTTDNNDTK